MCVSVCVFVSVCMSELPEFVINLMKQVLAVSFAMNVCHYVLVGGEPVEMYSETETSTSTMTTTTTSTSTLTLTSMLALM